MIDPDDLHRNRVEKTLNLLNGLDQCPPETPIYRVFRLRYLLKMLRTGRNVLVKPGMWDDPFENIVFQKHSFVLDGKRVESSAYVRERFYGQCWTLNREETDALWRIYSPTKDGVRVTSTVGKLFDGFYREYDWRAWASYFMGTVLYRNEDEIVAFLKRGISAVVLADNRWTASSLLMKRKEFAHENEVRLLYIEYRIGHAQRNSTYSYKIDTGKTFTEMLFDPRMAAEDFQRYAARIRSLGYRGVVAQSKLYQVPSILVRVGKQWDAATYKASTEFTGRRETTK